MKLILGALGLLLAMVPAMMAVLGFCLIVVSLGAMGYHTDPAMDYTLACGIFIAVLFWTARKITR